MQQTAVNEYKLPKATPTLKIIKQKKFSISFYRGMHITFPVPQNTKVTQINQNLIAITKNSSKNTNDGLLIYSTSINNNTNNLQLPFRVPAKIKSVSDVPKKGFMARQVVYSDGKSDTVLLILKRKQQLIVLHMPTNTKDIDAQSISEVVNTIEPLSNNAPLSFPIP